MRREDFYISTAPVFATYLGATSGNEALKYASFNTAELDEAEARRLFVASLMPTPSAQFIEDKIETARQFGYALAQEEAGVDRQILVHSFLESMRAIAVAKTEAKMRLYESVSSSLGAIFLLPLFFLFLWAVGVFAVDPALLFVLVFGVTAALAAVALLASPMDLNLWKTYEWSLPAGVATAALTALLHPRPPSSPSAPRRTYGSTRRTGCGGLTSGGRCRRCSGRPPPCLKRAHPPT
jgi:hypothetical protein